MQVGAQGSGPGLEEETLANRLARPTWVRVAKATDSTLLSLLAHHHVAGRGTRGGKRKPQSRAADANFSLPKNTTPLPLQQKGKERRGGLGWGEQVRRKGGIPTSLAEMVLITMREREHSRVEHSWVLEEKEPKDILNLRNLWRNSLYE